MPAEPLARRLAAEAFGTAILLATVVGSGIMAERLTDNAALALLCNTLATGAILVVIVTIFAPVSGAHFNPAVSLVMAVTGRLAPADLGAYVAVQCAAGIVGVMVAHAMFDLPLLAIGDHARTGASQWLAEIVATFAFALVLAILGGSRNAPQAVPWLVALTVTAAYWFTASTSFANPAVALARGFTRTFSGIALAHVPAFVIAEIAGALLAAAAARFLFAPR